MPKQLNVNLAFTADTAQAKQQIQELQQSLAKLSSETIKNNIGTKMTEDLHKSVTAASQLKDMLQQAVNPKTGNLDLSRFSEQLKASGRDIQSYAQDLNNLGPEGTKAFMQLAQSVASAEVPMRRTNALVKEFGTTLMNAARWQFSSSMLHGFMGAIQGAYGYAQDLNRSLTDIAIVTGNSVDNMAAFADQANKSAQALSTSTLAYTDAALIYYQQGLNDEEVQARTETTLKMSNVTRQSAEEVSSYMTAIWNNFAEGSDNLELFADKITALGAATASSSKEIATGLQQFAALGSSLGLNYDDAVAALATVVAQTRQSASTVGNSFRTLLQRFESLKLGKTLEDGVGLTKYSEALAKVGVQVLDVNGEMRDMSDVIQDLGAKWQTLGREQQNALAQTVGGVRNSNTLIAWMDHFDEFQKNLDIAANAEGALEKQAEIYAESWEAAQKRVQAAWQAIYQDLIDDKFFITILNGFEKVLKGVDNLIDGMGGLKGVLGVVGALITTVFADGLAKGIQNAVYNFKVFTGQAQQDADALAVQFKNVADQMGQDLQSPTATAEVGVLKDQIDFALKLRQASDSITEANKQQLLSLNEITKQYGAAYVEAMKLKEAAEDQRANAAGNAREYAANLGNTVKEKSQNRAKVDSVINSENLDKLASDFTAKQADLGKWASNLADTQNFDVWKDSLLPNLEAEFKVVIDQSAELQDAFENVNNVLSNSKSTDEEKAAALQQLGEKFKDVANNSDLVKEHIADSMSTAAVDIAGGPGQAANELAQKMKDAANAHFELKAASEQADNAQINYNERLRLAKEEFEKLKGKVDEYSTCLVTCARGISQLWTAFNSLGKVLDTLNDKDLTWAEKIRTMIPSLTMGIPTLISGITTLGGAFASLGWAAEGATASSMTFMTALTATPLGPILLALGALAGAWYAFDKIVYTSEERLADSNKKLEEANEALSKAEEAAQKTNDAYQKLVDTLDGFDSKKDAINQLIEGTTEWKEAIADSNSELLAALEMSGQLSQAKLSYGKGGLISVDNADELKSNARSDNIAADIGVALSRINVSNEESNHALIEAVNEIRNLNDHEAYQRGDISYDQLIDYNKTIGRQSDEELLNTVKDWAQQIVDNGYAGQDLTRELIEDSNGQLAFLEEIKDRKDVLQAIQKAADQIAGADKESDAYKKEVGRMAADSAGYDTSGMSGSALENFYLKLYENLQSQAQTEWEGMDQNQQLKYFAEGSGGQYKYDEATSELIETASSKIVESSEIAQSEIKTLGQAALIEEKASAAEAQDLIKYETESIKKQQQDLYSKVSNNFGDQLTIENASTYSDKMDQWSSEQMNFAIQTDMSQFETIEEFIKYVEDACKEEHHIDFEVNADDLVNFKGKTEDLKAEVDTLSHFLQNNIDKFQDLSEHIVECKEAADKVAYSFLRFDDAMQDVSKNYKKWKKALDSGDVIEMNNAVQDLKKTYGNLLDMDGSQLSDDFLRDSKNLDLMNTVLTGTEEEAIAAYEELQKIAFMDLGENLIPNLDESKWEEAYNTVTDVVDRLNLKLGDPLTPMNGVDYTNTVNSLNEMLAAVGDDIDAANAIMAASGWSGELTDQPVDVEEPDFKEDVNVDVVEKDIPYEGVHVETTDTDFTPSTTGTVNGTASEVHFSKGAQTTTQNKKTAHVQAYQIKSDSALHYTGGAAPKIKSMPARNLGSGNGGKKGGGCFASGTLITTNHNYKNIEDVKIGDIVLSYNEKTKKNEYSKVLQTMIHNVYEKIYSLFVKNDKLKVTGNHRFLVIHNNEQKWIEAADLQVGDLVLFANGSLHQISKIDTQLRFMTVYNFEVSNTHNYYVGENQILAHNKGKSGSSKEKKKKVEKPKEKKENIKEKDRYHNIKEAIEDLNTEMDRLNKNKDRAYGKQRLKYMDDEIKKTKDQIGLTKKYIAEIKNYSKVDRKNLEDALGKGWTDINTGELVGGLGLSDEEIKSAFDEKGILKDYESLFNKIQDKFDQTATKAYNAAVDEYNKAKDVFNVSDQGDAATEVWEKAKEKFEQAEEAYDKQKENYDKQLKYLNQYEDTMNLMQEKEQELLDQQNSLFDKALELVSKKIELKISIADNEQKYLEWVYDNIGDSADRAADRIANLGKQAQSSAKKVQANAEGLRDMLSKVTESYKGQVDFSDINMTLDINDPKAMLTTINQVIEKMQSKGLEAPVEDIVNLMNGYRDALMEEYNNLRDINEQVTENMVDAFEDMMDSLNENLDKNDGFQSLMDHYKEIRDLLGQEQLGLSDEEMRKWDQQMLDIKRDAAQVAQANYIAAHDAAERARKEYEEAIKSGNQFRIDRAKEVLKTTEEAEKAAQDEALTRLEETLQKAKEMYEQALEDNEKAYQRSLGGGILPTLDKLQDQFDMQKEINDLHLDDYEKYKKLGDLQANINKQLANNPNVKVQGKLKDLMDDVNDKMAAGAEISEGEATILEKRLQLLQAEDQLMAARNAKSAVRMTRDNEGNFSYTYTADTSKIEEAQQNYADKFYDLLDYERQYSEDTQAAILQSYKEFLDKRNDIINDESLTQSEKEALLRQLEKDMKAKVEFYTNEMEMVTGEMGRLRDEDWADMEKTLGRMLAAPDDFETKFEDTTLGKMAPAWKDAKDGLEGFVNAAKTLTDADLGAYGKWIQENEISMQNVGSSTAEYGEKLSSIYDGLKTKSTEAKDAAKGMADQMQEDFPKILEQGREFDEKFSGYLSNITTNLENVVKAINDVTAALSGVDKKWNLQDLLSQALGKNANSKDSEILDEDPTAGFDTGGYTGKWGSTNGKLAVLHQKEIVLNEDDTSNMLKAVDIVRSISNAINLNNAINPNMFSNIIDYSKLAAAGTTDLQQQVHIEASFPNVQSHSEIELAFNNLINSASQYVNRKR